MSYKVRLEEIESQPVAFVRRTVNFEKLAETVGAMTGEVFQFLQEQESPALRHPYTRYHNVNGGEIDLEAGWILEHACTGQGKVEADTLPGGPVAVTTHVGEYAKLPAAGEAIGQWLDRNGRSRAGPNWEIYRITWGQSEDPASWETDVYAPLASE